MQSTNSDGYLGLGNFYCNCIVICRYLKNEKNCSVMDKIFYLFYCTCGTRLKSLFKVDFACIIKISARFNRHFEQHYLVYNDTLFSYCKNTV